MTTLWVENKKNEKNRNAIGIRNAMGRKAMGRKAMGAGTVHELKKNNNRTDNLPKINKVSVQYSVITKE